MPMAQELSTWSGRKAYVLDLPGFGGSILPSVTTIEQYSELVAEFCRYMELAKVVIVGHSLGGRVGIVLAARHSKLVGELVLIDPAGVKPRSLRRVILAMIAKLFAWIPRGWRARLSVWVMDSDYRNSPALRDLYRAVVRADLRDYLPMISCPTRLVWGEEDKILPITLTKIYRSALRKRRVRLVWGAGHDPHLSHPQETLAILQEAVE